MKAPGIPQGTSPAPTPEEAAAIVAALEALRQKERQNEREEPDAAESGSWASGVRGASWGGGVSRWSRWDREGF